MDITYKSDICHNYMVIKIKEYTDSNYKMNMLVNNCIKGLLKTSSRIIDNEISLYYDISSKQSMEIMFEKSDINYEKIKQFIMELNFCIEELKKYLLDPNDIILTPNMIFWDNQNGKVELCYYPDYTSDFKMELKALLEYILTKVNHSDKKAVELAYDLQKISIQTNFTLNEMIERIVDANAIFEKREEKQVDYEKELNNIYDNNNSKQYTSFVKTIVLCIISMGVLIGIFIYSKYIYNRKGLIFLIVLIGILILISYQRIYLLYSKKRYNIPQNHDGIYHQNEISIQSNIENTIVLDSLVKEDNAYIELVREEETEKIELAQFPFVIGKIEDKVNFIIPEGSISRMHARITKIDAEYYIEDLNSKNGTYINDERIEVYQKVKIQHGDIIKFARIPYRFNYRMEYL